MSREIKFRVWDKDINKYVYISETVDGGFWVNNGISQAEMPTNRDSFEQYTGLKDKNGKEIYDGDLVSEHNGDITGEIIQQAAGTWLIRWIGGSETDTSVLFEEHYLCDVIGNIHENPELLGGKNE